MNNLIDPIHQVITDENDELFSCDQKDIIHDIFKSLSEDVQVCFYFTLMPPNMLKATQSLMHGPVMVLLVRNESRLDLIRKIYISVQREEQKYDTSLYSFASI